MRNTLIVILLFTCFALFGQGTNPMHTTHRVVSTGGSATNMITDPDFSGDGSDWDISGNWTYNTTSETMDYDDVASNQYGQQAADMVSATEVSTTYTIKFDVSGLGGGNTANITIVAYDNSATYEVAADYADGSHTVPITTPSNIGSGGIGFRASYFTTNAAFSMDNIEMYE